MNSPNLSPNLSGIYHAPVLQPYLNIDIQPEYHLRCLECGWETYEDNYALYCPLCGPGAFLMTVYANDRITDTSGDPSCFYSYQNLLPYKTMFNEKGPRIGCIKANSLGGAIGLKNLWLLLPCYAPEFGATFSTATFKELEALGVLARVQEQTSKILIVSSAGNAGQAFLEIGAKYGLPAVVLVPESALPRLYVSVKPDSCSPILIVLRNAHYPDAIRLVGEIQETLSEKLVREGGCYNVARRDSIGVLIHRAVKKIGKIPDHYVQAVGSGTGAIAAWEATKRLNLGNKSDRSAMKLHLVQNSPFTPMVDAWRAKKKKIEKVNQEDLNSMLSQTYSKVLSNSNPPYSVTGGVYDALSFTNGNMYAVTNQEAKDVKKLMIKHTNIIPDPEASISLAGLCQALGEGQINPTDLVLLHITGGGWSRSLKDLKKTPYPVAQYANPDEFSKIINLVNRYLDKVFVERESF